MIYRVNGEPKEIAVAPDFIRVRPLPFMSLDYFLPGDVFADDPMTDPIEPTEPFTLGVRVRNTGDGAARAIRIVSAQPEIVENRQGLLIDFRILGSTIDDQPASPSLLIDFGDLNPSQARVGRWVMETTLAGRFIEFTAEVSHSDDLGGELTSLVQGSTHFLVRDVLVDLPGRDRARDFLATDRAGTTLSVFESGGLDTAVLDQSALSSLVEVTPGRLELRAPETAGFLYVKLPDPYHGAKQLAQVWRADGKELRTENVWFSRTRNRDKDTWEYFLNLFDVNGGGDYALAVEDLVIPPSPPVMQFIPDRRVAEGRRLGFIVEASDPNGTVPTIGAVPLPPGAAFRDESDDLLATWAFDLPVAVGQARIAADGT